MDAFTEAFDMSTTIAEDKTRIFKQNVPVHMFPDSKQGFDVTTREKRPAEKRLAINVMAAHYAYRRVDIDRAGLIRDEHNQSDALSKIKHKNTLCSIFANHKDQTPVQKWIHRTGFHFDADAEHRHI